MKELVYKAATPKRNWECSAKIIKNDSLGVLARVSGCGSTFIIGIICYFSHKIIGNEYFLMLPDYKTGFLISDNYDDNLEQIRNVEENMIDATTIARAVEALINLYEFGN